MAMGSVRADKRPVFADHLCPRDQAGTQMPGVQEAVPAELEVCPYCGSKKKVCSGDSC